MQAPRTLKKRSTRRRSRLTGRLRRYLHQWVRLADDSRASQWLRDTIPTTGRWFRHTLPAATEQWLREAIPVADRWLRQTLPTTAKQLWADLDRDRLRARSALAMLLLAVAVVPVTLAGGRSAPTAPAGDLTAALEQRAAAGEVADRGLRGAGLPDAASSGELLLTPLTDVISAAATPEPSEAASPAPTKSAEPRRSDPEPSPTPTPKRVEPIAGLNETQMEHAATIVRVGQEMGLPRQAYVVALATALQESNLRNLANPVYPDSYQYRHDGSGYDHDSVGLFQQRPSMGWGTVAQIMDPEYSARAFYQRLKGVPGWENMPVTVAAQTVQVSAFPDYYAKHEPLARKLVDALT